MLSVSFITPFITPFASGHSVLLKSSQSDLGPAPAPSGHGYNIWIRVSSIKHYSQEFADREAVKGEGKQKVKMCNHSIQSTREQS